VLGDEASATPTCGTDRCLAVSRAARAASAAGGGARSRPSPREVAGDLEDLHAVAQRLGDLRQHVRGGEEHHLRQVERHVEVVVEERVVLLGIEHFEQRRTRIAAEVAAELVDLVEQHHRVVAAARLEALQDAPGIAPM
jgi:hypothetical protein